jgi:hypothetical protein
MLKPIHSIYVFRDDKKDLIYEVFEYQSKTIDIKIYDQNKKYLYRIDNIKKQW